MFKRQRDITPPTSDDEEPRRRLVQRDTESSDDEDNIRPPPRKRRPMVIYSDTESSDDEDDEDLTSYYTIKTVQSTRRSLEFFEFKGKSFSSTSRVSLTMFCHISSYQDYLIGW